MVYASLKKHDEKPRLMFLLEQGTLQNVAYIMILFLLKLIKTNLH